MANYYFGKDVDISSIRDHLKSFTNDELKAIVEESSNERIDSLINDLPQIKTLDRERESLIENNKKMAENNLSLESKYRMARQELTKSLEECQAMKNELDKKKDKLKEFSRQHSLDTTLALMQAAMAEAEEASDEVANSFLKKEISIENFLKDFAEKRNLFHSRRIKVEKMPGEISKIQLNPTLPGRSAINPPNLPFSNLSMGSSNDPNPPYPTNPFGSFFPYPQNYN